MKFQKHIRGKKVNIVLAVLALLMTAGLLQAREPNQSDPNLVEHASTL